MKDIIKWFSKQHSIIWLDFSLQHDDELSTKLSFKSDSSNNLGILSLSLSFSTE